VSCATTSENSTKHNNHTPAAAIRVVLLIGMMLSLLTMTTGLLLAFGRGDRAFHRLPIKSLLPAVLELNSNAVMDLGILLLIATPVAGVVIAIIGALVKRNKDAVVGFLVLAILAVSFALARR